jgi:hypothetical protein
VKAGPAERIGKVHADRQAVIDNEHARFHQVP